MIAIIFRVTLLEPALLTSLEGDPNESVSFNHIPGSVLRGALIGQYMNYNDLKELDVADKTVQRLFFDGTTRFLNGYPYRFKKRALPVPLSWQQDKRVGYRQTETNLAPAFDLAIARNFNEELTRPINVKAPFWVQQKDSTYLVNPERQLAIHTTRNRRFGRAILQTAAEAVGEPFHGAVYRYEALAAGETFAAAVLCDHDADAEVLLPLLEGELRLGGSRSAGYGLVQIGGVEKICNEEAQSGWREADGALAQQKDGKLMVTLLSDLILRDKNGQHTLAPEAVAGALSQKLGVNLDIGTPPFTRCITVGGFNRKWGLPLPQALAFQKGSVFIYKAAEVKPEILHDLEFKGIGERRAEGFGRLAFNWQSRDKITILRELGMSKPLPFAINDAESRKLAERMSVRLYQQKLGNSLAATAATVAKEIVSSTSRQKLPSSAQVSRLRGIIRDEMMKEKPEIQRLNNYIAEVKNRKSAFRQFEKARVEGKNLLDWINSIISKTSPSEWEQLFKVKPVPALGGVPVAKCPEDTKRVYYLLRYIDAVLASMVKQTSEEGS